MNVLLLLMVVKRTLRCTTRSSLRPVSGGQCWLGSSAGSSGLLGRAGVPPGVLQVLQVLWCLVMLP